ncbi:MAG: SLBB domain-containing protein [Bacteroidales bacterium]
MTRIAAIALVLAFSFGSSAMAQTEYVVGPQDVLTITVFDQAELTGKFTVDADGTFAYPILGRLKASGLTLRALENEIKRLLTGDYIKNPQVTVAVEQYRSQRIFVHGEVRTPGTYPLKGDMTLLEALASAGSTTPTAGDEALVVRPRSGKAQGPILPGQQADAETIRVSLKDLQAGTLAGNVALRDGDTVVVPKAKPVFVTGQVRNPGAYTVEPGMTVLQAIALAGGVTERGSTGRIKIIRVVKGSPVELKAKVTNLVQPGDTVVVPEKYF